MQGILLWLQVVLEVMIMVEDAALKLLGLISGALLVWTLASEEKHLRCYQAFKDPGSLPCILLPWKVFAFYLDSNHFLLPGTTADTRADAWYLKSEVSADPHRCP